MFSLSVWTWFWGIRKWQVGINQENIGHDLIVKSHVLPKTVLILQCEVLCFLARGINFLFLKLRSYLTNSLKQTRQYLDIIFLIHHSLWMIPWLCFLAFEIKMYCFLKSLVIAIPCFAFLFWDHTQNTRSHHPLQLSSKEPSSSTNCINSLHACSLRAFHSLVKRWWRNVA